MNRIYQGRVSRVEIPNPKFGKTNPAEAQWLRFHADPARAAEITVLIEQLRPGADAEIKRRNESKGDKSPKSPQLLEFERLQDETRSAWEDALWRHHKLFQDAVNYYTVALAAMAECAADEKTGENAAMADFAGQVKERWKGFLHKGQNRSGLRPSLCRTLGLSDDETSTWDVCTARILEGALKYFPMRKDVKDRDVFHGVIAEMFPEKSRGLNPQKMSNTDWPWLCWANASGETPAKAYYRKNRGIHDFMSKLFDADNSKLNELAKIQVADTCLTSVEQTEDEGEEGAEDVASIDGGEGGISETDGIERFIGSEAVAKLQNCVATAKELLGDNTFKTDFVLMDGNPCKADDEFTRIERAIADKDKDCAKKPESLSFQKWKAGGKGKDNKRIELFVLFGFDKGSLFTAALLKARVKRLRLEHLRKNDPAGYVVMVEKYGLCGPSERERERVDGKEPFNIVADARKKAENTPLHKTSLSTVPVDGDDDYIQAIRDKNGGIVFPGFTAIRGFVTPTEEKAADGAVVLMPWKIGTTEWKNFEFAAFEEALKSPNQIKKKTEERTKERKKLETIRKLYDSKGREKATNEDGEEEGHLPGFKGDARFTVIEALHKTLAVEDGVEPDKTYEYGFSQATLRGYEELCTEWNKRVQPGEAFIEEKANTLRDEVLKEHQREHRDDVGAVRLFDELLKKENWCLWQAPTIEQEKARKENNHSTNILRDYLRYQEIVEKIKALEKKVNYTPADASLSRRLFDFKAGAQGGFGHDYDKQGGTLCFTTHIAIKNGIDYFSRQQVRIHYTAPRLLRDASRVLSEEEKLKDANWMPPMMDALGIVDTATHDFSKQAVSLMPDWKAGSWSDTPDRLLLNFVLTPKESDFIGKLRKTIKREIWPWPCQFNVNGDFNDASLRWPHENWDKALKRGDFPKIESNPVKWFEESSLSCFRFLSVDLGQKQAGAYALMEANSNLSIESKEKARYIGTIGEGESQRDWYARVLITGLLKLPGENARVFRPNYRNRKPVEGTGKFQEELSGSAGRRATEGECLQTISLLTDLQQLDLLDEDCRDVATLKKRLMLPDQNAKLLVAIRRAQSFAGRSHRWCWFLDTKAERKDQAQRQRTAIKEIAETDPHPWLCHVTQKMAQELNARLKENKDAAMPTPDPRIAGTLAQQLECLIKQLPGWVQIIANRIYHSRKGRFVWGRHPDKADCHLLGFTEWSKEERDRLTEDDLLLAGQRGISIERIEQIEELRKRCQSLNQMLRRSIGGAPMKSRDDSIPDPCPSVLAKLDNIKEQRRNQTANLILAVALGLRLRESAELKTMAERELAEAKDQHGEYERVDIKGHAISPDKPSDWRGIVDFTVIEDLSRYRTTQGRAPRENSRLMKWCHRAIRDKLKEMCQAFGIPLLETPAAYSSRFCSRTGVAGFRATELSPPMLDESKWRWRVKGRDDGKEETPEQQERRNQWEAVFADIRKVNQGRDGITKGQEYRTLLVPDAGGSVFIPVADLDERYQRPAKDAVNPKLTRPIVQYLPVKLENGHKALPRLVHADVNAAVNLGLRAVSDPRVWSIHSRLRSEREVGSAAIAKPKESKRGKKCKSSAEESLPMPIEEKKVDKFFAKEKRKHGIRAETKAIAITIDPDKAALKASESRHPNFFADFANLSGAQWGAAELQSLLASDTKPPRLVSGKALWRCVKDLQWPRCMKINSQRLADAKKKELEADSLP